MPEPHSRSLDAGNYPDPDFLWATTDPRGDRSAAFANEKINRGYYRNGETLHVRFILDAADVLPWAGYPGCILSGLPMPTASRPPAAGSALIRPPGGADRSRYHRTLAGSESRSYNNPAWRPVDCAQKLKVLVQTGGVRDPTDRHRRAPDELPSDAVLGLAIQDAVYASARDAPPGQRTMISDSSCHWNLKSEATRRANPGRRQTGRTEVSNSKPDMRVMVADNGQVALASSNPSILMKADSNTFFMRLDAVLAHAEELEDRQLEFVELLDEVRAEILKGDTKRALELIGREIGW